MLQRQVLQLTRCAVERQEQEIHLQARLLGYPVLVEPRGHPVMGTAQEFPPLVQLDGSVEATGVEPIPWFLEVLLLPGSRQAAEPQNLAEASRIRHRWVSNTETLEIYGDPCLLVSSHHQKPAEFKAITIDLTSARNRSIDGLIQF